MPRLIAFLALVTSPAFALESAVPAAFPSDRYEKMSEKSPFALATPAVPVTAPQASFAANWFLTAAGRDAQGRDFVTVKAQDGSAHFSLYGNEPYPDESSPANGVSLASINWSDTFRETTAIIKKGAETAKLVFSKEEAVAVAAPPAGIRPALPNGQQPPPITVRAGATGGVLPQPGMQPRINLPRPSTAPVVSPPPPVTGNGAQPAAGQPGGTDRRRIRNIAAPQ